MTGNRSNLSSLKAALVYFGMVFAVGFLLGAIRVPLLVPRLGVRMAELLEMPLMLIAIYLAAGLVVRRYGAVVHGKFWLLAGFIAFDLMVSAEVVLARLLTGRSIGEYVTDRDPVSGSVYLVMLVIFGLMPWLRILQATGKPR